MQVLSFTPLPELLLSLAALLPAPTSARSIQRSSVSLAATAQRLGLNAPQMARFEGQRHTARTPQKRRMTAFNQRQARFRRTTKLLESDVIALRRGWTGQGSLRAYARTATAALRAEGVAITPESVERIVAGDGWAGL